MPYSNHSELIITLWAVKSSQQWMVPLAPFILISLFNQLLLLFSSFGQLLEAIVTEIDEISSCVWFTTATHRNIPCLSLGPSTATITHETSFIAFTFIFRLNIFAHTFSVYILVWLEDSNGVFVNGISGQRWGGGILFFSTISASVDIACEEIVVRVFKLCFARLTSLSLRNIECLNVGRINFCAEFLKKLDSWLNK